MMRLKSCSTCLMLLVAMVLAPARVMAEDTEVYFSAGSAGADVNILFMLDTSGSMGFCGYYTSSNCQYSDKRMAQLKEAFSGLIDSLGGNIKVGVGRFNYDDGGRILYPVSALDDPVPTELELGVRQGEDDAAEGDSFAVSDGEIAFPNAGSAGGETGFIFREVRIPRYAVITGAKLIVQSRENTGISLNVRPSYASGNGLSSFASQPPSSLYWNWTDTSPIGVTDYWNWGSFQGLDVTDLVQEAVNDRDWCGMQDLALKFRSVDAASTDARIIESADDSDEPRLRITWQPNPGLAPLDPGDPDYESSLSCMGGQTYSIAVQGDDGDEQGGTVKLGNHELMISDGGIASYRFRNVALNPDGTYPDLVHSAILKINGVRASHVVEEEVCKRRKWDWGSWSWVCKRWETEQVEADLTEGSVTLAISGVSGNASALVASNGNISSRTVEGDTVEVTLPADDFKSQHSIDVTDLVNAMIDSGWTEGGALMFNITATDSAGRTFALGASDGGVTASLTLSVSSADQGTYGALKVRDKLKEIVNDLPERGSTPLGESYTEAMAYMLGEDVHYGGKVWNSGDGLSHPDTYSDGVYHSPIDTNNECGSNHVVLMTDGSPQSDNDLASRYTDLTGKSTVADACDGGDTFSTEEVYSCLAEIAGWAARDDATKPAVSTHMIGFYLDENTHQLMRNVTEAGNGFTKTADSASELQNAFTEIVNEIAQQNAAMAAPGVAVNQLNRFSFLNQVYFGLFRPVVKTHWAGNLKRYRLAVQSGQVVIVDQNGTAAVNPDTGFFKDTSNSYWGKRTDGTDPADGPNVNAGGAVEELVNQSQTRTLYVASETPAPSGGALALSRQSGVETLSLSTWSDVPASALGLPATADDDLHSTVFDWLMQEWGDPLHSEPLLVNFGYSGTLEEAATNPDQQDNTLFVATNDGMLRAIEPATGKELFAFTTPDQLVDTWKRYDNPSLSVNSYARTTYGFDGGITLWRKPDGNGVEHVFLYLAQRRGGRNYYALDVTDRTNPQLLWRIGGGEAPFEDLGQTWSRPTLGQVSIGGKKVPVLVFGGGYSPADHDAVGHVSSGDEMGNAIYIVNAYTGALIWSTSNSGATVNNPDMKWSVAASPALVDIDFDGVTDYIYAADLAGQVFRVDLNADATGQADLAYRTVTLAKLGATADGGIGNHRRFFAAPVVSLGYTDDGPMLYVSLGSGYRPHPTDRKTQDMIFTVIDRYGYKMREEGATVPAPITIDDLADVTSTVDADVASVQEKGGWYLKLESGEKVVSSGVVIPVPDPEEGEPDAVLVIPSYVPDATSVTPCTNVIGKTRQYALGVRNGGKTSVMAGTVAGDRAQELNLPGLPPDPQWVVIDGVSAVITGTGAVQGPPVEELGSFKRTRWFQAESEEKALDILDGVVNGQ